MNLTTQQKLIAAIAITVALVVVAVVVLVVPQFGRLGELDSQISQQQQQIQSNQTLLKRRQEVKGRSAQTQTELLRLANEVPESPELPALIIELQDAANESGLEFVSLLPATPVVGKVADTADDTTSLYETVRIQMTVRGSWQDTVDLLQRLRRLTRQIRVWGLQSVRFEDPVAEDGEDAVGKVDSTVTLEAYTMAPSDATTTTVAPPPATTAQ